MPTDDNAKYREAGTPVSGYAENGPYHCEDCVHLRSGGYCSHPAVMADPAIKKPRRDGMPKIDEEHGCCRFVKTKLD